MVRLIGRMVALLLVAGGVCGALASSGGLQVIRAHAVQTVVALASATDVIDTPLPRVHPSIAPTPSPSPSPAPAPSVAPARSQTAVRLPVATPRPIPPPDVTAQELALVNLDTGRFLWQSNSRSAWAPASLTKIFTAMVALDLMRLDTVVTVPASVSQLPPDSTVMGLTPGEQVTVRQLMYGVFLNSGNDAAETLASAVTSRATFIADMNAKAARLGLHTTHFQNPTGLDAAGHYSSAYDLAVAATYLEYHYGSLISIASTPSITFPATATHKTFVLTNLNKLLWTYPGTYGLKTGWTDAALGCLITTSSRGGHRILAVMLGAPNGTAYAQMPAVLDYGFELLGVLPRPATS